MGFKPFSPFKGQIYGFCAPWKLYFGPPPARVTGDASGAFLATGRTQPPPRHHPPLTTSGYSSLDQEAKVSTYFAQLLVPGAHHDFAIKGDWKVEEWTTLNKRMNCY